MLRLLWVCLGGAVGSGARYLVSGWVLKALGNSLPYGTFAVNFIGSFLLGLLMHIGLSTDALSPEVRLALTTGAMGGFTTYSTFSYETMMLIHEGAWGGAAINVTVTVVGCLAASFVGLFAGRWLVGA